MESHSDIDRWAPNKGPQTRVLQVPETVFEILYGGARGGGKTDAGLVWLTDHVDHPLFRALVIRRNADDLSDWVDRASRMYKRLGVSIAYKPPILTFPSGAIIRCGHLKDDQAYTKYQGHEYHRLLIEELTQIPSEKRYLDLLASLRSTVPGITPQVFCTTNPGGQGHVWVKKRWNIVDRSTWGKVQTDPDSGLRRIFIHATVDSNPMLLERDPQYVNVLEGYRVTDPNKYKMWRMGDWDVMAGQAFSEWNYDDHVVPFVTYPLEVCDKIICFDWGYTAPGCAYWIAFAPENAQGVRRAFVYREIYQSGKTPDEWAREIKYYTRNESVKYMVLPHDCYATKTSNTTIADTFKDVLNRNVPERYRVRIIPAATLNRGARITRKAIMHQYLSIAPDGRPYVQFDESCSNAIETLPSLIIDESNPEDIDTTGDDHAYDAISTGLMTYHQQNPINPAARKLVMPIKAKKTWQTDSSGLLRPKQDVMKAAAKYSTKRKRAL